VGHVASKLIIEGRINALSHAAIVARHDHIVANSLSARGPSTFEQSHPTTQEVFFQCRSNLSVFL
jgi:hypothetical protein